MVGRRMVGRRMVGRRMVGRRPHLLRLRGLLPTILRPTTFRPTILRPTTFRPTTLLDVEHARQLCLRPFPFGNLLHQLVVELFQVGALVRARSLDRSIARSLAGSPISNATSNVARGRLLHLFPPPPRLGIFCCREYSARNTSRNARGARAAPSRIRSDTRFSDSVSCRETPARQVHCGDMDTDTDTDTDMDIYMYDGRTDGRMGFFG